jgi:uncharacterized protein (DUF1684 family)
MKKRVAVVLLLLAMCTAVTAQTDSAATMKDIKQFQDGLNNEYKAAATSPLTAEQRKTFRGIRFFPASLKYVVKAGFTRTPAAKAFNMPTSGSLMPEYVKYGEVKFTLLGKEYTLGVYQSLDLAKKKEYKDYLVILFKDQTSGKETYGGGRYIDLTTPQGNTIIINFNKAYQPYCAYAEGFNCPVPPKENYLPVRVEAGVRQ